jgi:PhnB protein
MPGLHPYLNFNGNCEQAFNLYKSVFGGEFASVMRNKDMPKEAAFPASNDAPDMIIHMSLPVGKNSMLMGSDVPGHVPKSTQGTNFYISIDVESEAEATRIFNGLLDGGTIHMPLDKTFWGSFFGMGADKFGIQWMISYNYSRQ